MTLPVLHSARAEEGSTHYPPPPPSGARYCQSLSLCVTFETWAPNRSSALEMPSRESSITLEKETLLPKNPRIVN